MNTYGHTNGDTGEVDTSRPTSFYRPVQGQPDTFWQRDPHRLRDFRSSEQLPQETELVIVGSGYAGVATAYHLLNEVPDGAASPSSITILEARGACSGATGRNGGHLRPDLYGHIPKYIARAGVDAGVEVAEFEVANMFAIKKVVEKEQIDCDFTLCRTVDVWCNEEAAKTAKDVYEAMVGYDVSFMDDVYFTSDKDTAEGYSGVKGALACASYTAGTMWPYKFILGLLEKLLATGKVNLQTHTLVTSITESSEGGFMVHTDRGAIQASRVVHASNAYVSGLLPEYERNIIPCKGICCHIDINHSAGKKAPLLNNSYINRTSDKTLSYLIPRTDGSIVVGGAASRFIPFRDQWYRNVDDTILIDSAKDYYAEYMQQTYNGWEDSGAAITKIWTGVMGYSFDSNPHVGSVPGRPGQYILAGFNGHGMPVIWLAAKGIARILTAPKTESGGIGLSFKETGIPRLFETTNERIKLAHDHSAEEGDILGSGQAFPQAKAVTSVR